MQPSSFLRARPVATLLLAVPALALFGLGCNRNPSTPPPPKPADVMVQEAALETIVDNEDFTGRLEAYKRVEIQARVTGFLEKVNFKEGGKVTEKDVLFEIDPRPYKAELDKAEASLVQARARLKRLEGDLSRALGLLRTRSISKEEYEKVVGDHDEAKAGLGVAQASRDAAKLFWDYTKVKPPFPGQVGRSVLDPGNQVKADMTVLTTIVSESPMYAYFDIDERTHLKLTDLIGKGKAAKKTRMPVRLALADETDFLHVGEVDFEDIVIDPATGTQRMRGIFKDVNPRFKPGLFVRVRLQVGPPRQAVVISEQGVGTDQGQKFVYVVGSNNKVEYRKVKTGSLTKGRRVIEEGLKAGERVIVSGLQKVRTGAEVVPREEEIDSAPPTEAPKLTIEKK
jgi:RND family efflux transporter MFP subunit